MAYDWQSHSADQIVIGVVSKAVFSYHHVLGSLCDNAEARFGNAIDRFGRSRGAEERESGLHLDTSIARKLA